jgi:hypothetical protein
MQQPPEDNSTTWVEDLDPEPQRREGLGQKRELILGLLLLLSVIGWAGWQWWSQNRNESEYAQGQQALAASNLDAAEAHFATIPDYKDAGSLAHDLALKIARRDEQYRQGTAAGDNGDWITAYNTLQQVAGIQPGYKDSQFRLGQAEQNIYTEAFSGTVVSRPDAGPPGLYYRQGGTWIWLQGSDGASQVRGTGPPGHLVYDAPGPKAGHPFADTDMPEGRNLMLATISPEGVAFQPLSLDPTKYDFFIWGERGLWGLKSQIEDQSRSNYALRPDYGGYAITHEEYTGNTISEMTPKSGNWSIMDLAPDGEHVLLADIGDYASNNPVTQLYVADADGTNLHFLYTNVGGFFRALFSPDSKRVLVNTYSHLGFTSTAEIQEVLMLDATGQREPLVLGRTEVLIDPSTYGRPFLSSSFIQAGKYRGDALLVEWGATGTSISLIDPNIDVGDVVHRWTVPGDAQHAHNTWAGEIENDQGFLMAFQSTPITGNPYLNVVWDTNSFQPNGPTSGPSMLFNWTSINLAQGENLQRAWLRDGYLVYVTSRPSGTSSSGIYALSTRKLPIFAELRGEPPVPLTITQRIVDGLPDPGFDYGVTTQQLDTLAGSRSVALGPGLLARGKGQLEVESYDGGATANMEAAGYLPYDWTQYEVFRDLR